MKIYLMRHGETDYNKKGLIQGRLDIPLNENGLELARLTRDGFDRDGIRFDYCYCSPLIRARQTADILLEGTDTPITYDERICEMNFAEGEGIPLKQISEDPQYKNIDYLFHDPEKYHATEKGEDYADLFARVSDFLENELYAHENDYENVLVCCHGGIIRAFLAFMKKLELGKFWDNHQPNCSVNIIEIKNHKLQILEEHRIYYELPEEKKGTIL
ncbi:MAG: histidine phosphatase family protein [Lachnospiraceae bacterium]|nr:histidine phosphatase family protein [Lachnospiraceae bacterium]